MLQKIIDFITGETSSQRKHEEWMRDYRRRFPPPGAKPRIVTMEEVSRRTRRVIENARRRGDLPPRSESRWAEFLDC